MFCRFGWTAGDAGLCRCTLFEKWGIVTAGRHMHVATVQQNIAEAGSSFFIFRNGFFMTDFLWQTRHVSGQTAILKILSSNMFEEQKMTKLIWGTVLMALTATTVLAQNGGVDYYSATDLQGMAQQLRQ